MSVFLLYPAVAFLAMFVVLVIMLILKYGPEYLNLRNYTLTRRRNLQGGTSYAQPVQNA
jgi:hypothetical protein